ncbi:M14 family zinc carboxypeptidase [Arenibacter latericius]|uniref:M14 family zinc carboxypeptidase n=1 Tax=Arenibacter latericius TaxID=86104 RepID=UPI0003FC74C8|nr:M14 family zinc carboxypeptidase [Arenibacter latericius]
MRIFLFALLVVFSHSIHSQETTSLDYYLPQNVSYNPNIPKPKDIIGHEVGEWHVTHDKLLFYMQTLAEASDRISLEQRGTTYEGRPLILLTITSAVNHSNIDQIRKDHIRLTETGSDALILEDMPIVVYQGFSIHGNEPSGSNAALAYAYYLAAANGPEIEETLNNTIVLLDPSYNPDGLQRFAYWANTNKGKNLVSDVNEREFHEVWPGGRTNHYWFDMNRDWLPVQLPESRARIASFHKWMPNILTDHHEMGTNSTFFFQPGVPSRVHPLTPKTNQELTTEIATYHAKALDNIGSFYYSEERFDDYFYGKGSTFPDINGSIGILFEQASSRGHAQDSDNGLLTFPFTIRNQFTTALSTIKAARNMRTKILGYQRQFYQEVKSENSKNKVKGIVFGDSKDAAKTWHLAEILNLHHIKFHELSKDISVSGKSFKKGYSYFIPTDQKNARLVKAMFEKRTTSNDSIFYDVSAWTFPLAFNLDYAEINSTSAAGDLVTELAPISAKVDEQSSYAYLFDWNEYYTPKALNKILNKGLRAKVGKTPFTVEGKSFDYGAIMIPVQNQQLNPADLFNFLNSVAKESKVPMFAVGTGHAIGIDLGSSDFIPLEKQRVALLVGSGVTSYDAGEFWHLLDQRYDFSLTKIDTDYFNNVDLSVYTSIVIPNKSRGRFLDEKGTEKLKQWVNNGGTLIGYRNMANWFSKNGIMKLNFKKDTLVAKNISYEQKSDFLGAQVTGGAIFKAKLDRSHPINFGHKNNHIPLFRNTNIYIEPDENSYNNPIQYTQDPLLSGYISDKNLKIIKNSVPFQVQRSGKGRVIIFTDNTNFRAFWFGTNKLVMNAIFFSKMM